MFCFVSPKHNNIQFDMIRNGEKQEISESERLKMAFLHEKGLAISNNNIAIIKLCNSYLPFDGVMPLNVCLTKKFSLILNDTLKKSRKSQHLRG